MRNLFDTEVAADIDDFHSVALPLPNPSHRCHQNPIAEWTARLRLEAFPGHGV